MSATAGREDTRAEILRHINEFMSDTLSDPDLRQRLFKIFRRNTSSAEQNLTRAHNLAAETLENAISTTNVSVRNSSLRLARKLLDSFPGDSFSSFLLSLIYYICDSLVDAAICLLNFFYFNPSLARSEIAPKVFDELFLIHFLPVLQWYNQQRSRMLTTLVEHTGDNHTLASGSLVVLQTKAIMKVKCDKALKLEKLERVYEDLLDENCKVFAWYFKEVLESGDEAQLIDPPLVVLNMINNGEVEKADADESKNGRVSPIVQTNQGSSTKSRTSIQEDTYFEVDYPVEDSFTSSDSEGEKEDQKIVSMDPSQQRKQQKQAKANPQESSRSPVAVNRSMDILPGEAMQVVPKDFVCPVTGNIFDDPVTLETGQTYERKAIQEWIDRGNSTCPITRQKLDGTQLPKTNYVLKRLIASWREQNPSSALIQSDNQYQESEPNFSSGTRSGSPNSFISHATVDSTVAELRLAIKNLCMSEILKESEMAVLWIERFWQEANVKSDVQSMLSKPPIINGFVEILFNSVDAGVLKATVFILSELGSRDDGVIQTLTRVESDVECVVALFKKGFLEAVVLVYLLRPPAMFLLDMDVVDSLLSVLGEKEDAFLTMCMNPKSASVLLLGQIVASAEESSISEVLRILISEKVIGIIVSSLEAEWQEERIAAVGILLRCMNEDGNCRNVIADKAELAPVLESFFGATDDERFQIVHFLSELVKLNRRTFNEQVLHIVKDEGTFSTMHTLLVYLQTASQDQCPVVAGLLLQLDALVEPQKTSIYREEAIGTLISCLKNKDFPTAQVAAAETILALQGRFSCSGMPLARAFLLKRAGLEKSYKSMMRKEKLNRTSKGREEALEEEKAAEEWERKIAYVLVSHEFGLLFEALAEGLKSRYAEFCAACYVSATWLVYMLDHLPDTGIRGAARLCLLKRFVSIFKSAKDTEDKALSMLALSSFIRDPEGLRDLTTFMKDILKGLRELKKISPVAFEMLKVLSEGNDSSSDMWTHKELVQEDCRINGEVLSIMCLKDKIFSGHSDGTIKVWTSKLHFTQETRQHTKAITSMAVSVSGDKLYSGSLDRTVRAWSIGIDGIKCEHVYDMKDHVNNLAVANSISCFIPQGPGIKVHSWNGASKLLNSRKYVKCLALVHGKLYCGCQDNSIQEIDLATGTLSNIQSSSKNFMSKMNPIYALQVFDGQLHSVSPSLDGTTLKIFSTSNYSITGSISSTLEVRSMAVSSDIIYLGCKGGIVEVWCRKKLDRKETLQTCTNGKILCMALDNDEEILVVGTSDGKIQAWELS